MKKRQFVRTTIAEPFPEFYCALSPQCRQANSPAAKGPFYAAGSQWYDLPQRLAYRERCAQELRKDGYTVAVELVSR